MKNLLFALTFISLTCSCENTQRDYIRADQVSNLEILKFKNGKKELMQIKIDSAIIVYDLAIQALKNGRSKEEVVNDYELKAAQLSQSAKNTFNEITQALESGKLSQKEYEDFMKSIKLDSVKFKSYKLETMGVVFDLKRTKK